MSTGRIKLTREDKLSRNTDLHKCGLDSVRTLGLKGTAIARLARALSSHFPPVWGWGGGDGERLPLLHRVLDILPPLSSGKVLRRGRTGFSPPPESSRTRRLSLPENGPLTGRECRQRPEGIPDPGWGSMFQHWAARGHRAVQHRDETELRVCRKLEECQPH